MVGTVAVLATSNMLMTNLQSIQNQIATLAAADLSPEEMRGPVLAELLALAWRAKRQPVQDRVLR